MEINDEKYLSFVRLDVGNVGNRDITLKQLKRILIHYHYPSMDFEELESNVKERELIVSEIKDDHNKVGTVVFSVNGSPPKGIGILRLEENYNDKWVGNIIMIGNSKVSKIKYDITILKAGDKND